MLGAGESRRDAPPLLRAARCPVGAQVHATKEKESRTLNARHIGAIGLALKPMAWWTRQLRRGWALQSDLPTRTGQPAILNPQPPTLNLQPSILNTKPKP